LPEFRVQLERSKGRTISAPAAGICMSSSAVRELRVAVVRQENFPVIRPEVDHDSAILESFFSARGASPRIGAS
jgi:hypothetical protein